ncbi:hypothetical protein BUALT_Bualt19G0028800 [Buddleja alternifolia]|uniref:Uncharacterized protein n=1 Tax=Buddleja alternifolia TaxID=168488 RepID=A0AAV6W4M8_9LAMI|nr:hypothetical protein BUALT_Bualt19G0028800 [Buddleja alternifolia]
MIVASAELYQDKDHHFMDKKEAGNEHDEDVTRESLIAISYVLPDSEPTAENSPKNTEGDEYNKPLDHDGGEKYRSMLISISYSPSPDTTLLPLLPGQLETTSVASAT